MVPRFLGPELYGLLSLFGLLRTSLSFLDLGISVAYYHHVADDMVKEDAAERVKRETENYFSTQVLINCIGICLVTGAAIYLFPRYSDQALIYTVGVVSIILCHLLAQLTVLARQRAVLAKRFKLIATVSLLGSLVGAVLASFGAIFFSVIGVLVAQPVETLFVCVSYLKKTGGVPAIRIDIRKSLEVLRSSLKYFYGGASFIILRYSDRVLIAGLLSMDSLGYYTLAHTLSENVKLLIASAYDVIRPMISERIARAGAINDLHCEIEEKTQFFFFMILFITGNCLIFADLLIYILPRFSSSIDVFRILIISMTVSAVPLYPQMLVQSKRVGKAQVLSNITIFSAVLNVALSYYLIISGYGIIGVATGTLVANSFKTIFIFYYMHFYLLEPENTLRAFARLGVPFVIIATLFFFKSENIFLLIAGFYIAYFLLYKNKIFIYFDLVRNWR